MLSQERWLESFKTAWKWDLIILQGPVSSFFSIPAVMPPADGHNILAQHVLQV